MPDKCSFCNNAVLEFQVFVAPNGKSYHQKCYEQSRSTLFAFFLGALLRVCSSSAHEQVSTLAATMSEEERAELAAKQRAKDLADFESQPKTLGTVDLGGRAGFVIDPRTGKKKQTNHGPGSAGASAGDDE